MRNLLPCGIKVTIAALELAPAKANELGWPVLPSVMYADPSKPEDAAHPPVEMRLAGGEHACTHDVCVLGPVDITVEIGGDTAGAEAGAGAGGTLEKCCGSLQLARPSDRYKELQTITLRSSRAGGPRAGTGQMLRLQCKMRSTTRAGSVELTLFTLHWVHNHSSLPLRFFESSLLAADATPVVEAPAHAAEGIPFSLSAEGDGRSGSCRIGIAPTSAASAAPAARAASAAPAASAARPSFSRAPSVPSVSTVFDFTERIADGRLTRPFSISVTGNEGELEVNMGHGQRAELVVSIVHPEGAAATLGAKVVEV